MSHIFFFKSNCMSIIVAVFVFSPKKKPNTFWFLLLSAVTLNFILFFYSASARTSKAATHTENIKTKIITRMARSVVHLLYTQRSQRIQLLLLMREQKKITPTLIIHTFTHTQLAHGRHSILNVPQKPNITQSLDILTHTHTCTRTSLIGSQQSIAMLLQWEEKQKAKTHVIWIQCCQFLSNCWKNGSKLDFFAWLFGKFSSPPFSSVIFCRLFFWNRFFFLSTQPSDHEPLMMVSCYWNGPICQISCQLFNAICQITFGRTFGIQQHVFGST